MDTIVPWRPWSLRDTVVHILAFPEIAYLSHEVGSMSWDDMQEQDKRLEGVTTAPQIAEYGLKVRDDIIAFLDSGNTEGFERVVPAHYGGEVTVLELLNIVLEPQHPPSQAGLPLHDHRPGHDAGQPGHRTPTWKASRRRTRLFRRNDARERCRNGNLCGIASLRLCVLLRRPG